MSSKLKNEKSFQHVYLNSHSQEGSPTAMHFARAWKASRLQCPSCSGERIWKDGIRYVREGQVQRYVCRSCGHRFSNSKVKVNVVKQGRVLSDSVHDFGDLDLVNVGVGEVGFQDSAFTVREDVGSHDFSVAGKTINKFRLNSREHRVCAREGGAKNLVEVESRTGKQAAGVTKLDRATIKDKIVEYLWYLKKQARASPDQGRPLRQAALGP